MGQLFHSHNWIYPVYKWKEKTMSIFSSVLGITGVEFPKQRERDIIMPPRNVFDQMKHTILNLYT